MKKNDPTTHTELEHLLTAQEDGILDEAGKERLEEILLADPEARNLYLRHIALCDHLAWEYTENASEPTEFRPRESKPSSPAILHPAWTMAAAALEGGLEQLDELRVPVLFPAPLPPRTVSVLQLFRGFVLRGRLMRWRRAEGW